MKKLIVPIMIGVLCTIVTNILGFEIHTWKYWLITLSIILSSVAYDLQRLLSEKP